MNDTIIIIHFLKAGTAIFLLYTIYKLCFASDTFFRMRRFYLLFAMLFAVTFPFITLHRFFNAPVSPMLYDYAQLPIEVQGAAVVIYNAGQGLSFMQIAFIIAISMAVLLLCKMLFQIFYIVKIVFTHNVETMGGHKVIWLQNAKLIPFSFFNYIFLPRHVSADAINEVLQHEQAHAQQWHSVDVLLAESICAMLWWNPFVWLLRREVKINLEHLADEAVLRHGADCRKYQYMLLHTTIKNTGIQIVNNFNVSQLKTRIAMMNKQKTRAALRSKYLLILPLVAFLLTMNSVVAENNQPKTSETQPAKPTAKNSGNVDVASLQEGSSKSEKTNSKEDKPFVSPEQMPTFKGGEEAMMHFIADNLKYPEEAQKQGVEGLVAIRFVITSKGKVTKAEILKGFDPSCNQEALRVVYLMPDWLPGTQNGIPVDTYFTLPILFRLKK